MYGSYYSGDLAAINSGRTADAAVAAGDAASFRRYLADLASNQTRRDLGYGDLGLRSSLGNRQLGLEENALGVRSAQGNRQLDLEAENQALRRMLGTRGLDLRGQELAETTAGRVQSGELARLGLDRLVTSDQNQYDLGVRGLDLQKLWYGSGAGRDWRAIEAENRRREDERLAIADSETAVPIANSALMKVIKSQPVTDGSWFHMDDYDRADRWKNNPDYRQSIVGTVLGQIGADYAPLVRFNDATGQFVPRFTMPVNQASPVPVDPALTEPATGTIPIPTTTAPSVNGFLNWRANRRR